MQDHALAPEPRGDAEAGAPPKRARLETPRLSNACIRHRVHGLRSTTRLAAALRIGVAMRLAAALRIGVAARDPCGDTGHAPGDATRDPPTTASHA